MANTVEIQTLINGERNLVVKVHIDGDGSGDEANRKIVDVASYGCAGVSIMHVQGTLAGFTAELVWEASSGKHALNIPDYDVDQSFEKIGGLANDAGAGKTGNLLIRTIGLGSGDTGHLLLTMKKKQ